MSKIVTLQTKIATPNILEDLLARVSVTSPVIAEWVKGLNTVPLIQECVKTALKEMGTLSGISASVGGSSARRMEGIDIVGTISSTSLSYTVYVGVEKDGTVRFVTDNMNSKNETDRIESLFKDVFTKQVVATILKVLNYDVTFTQVKDGSKDSVNYIFEGVKN